MEELSSASFYENRELYEIALSCCRKLFAAHGIELEPVEELLESPHLDLAGIVGLTGRDFRGTVVLACPDEVLVASYPSEISLRDWIGELTNQLSGRIQHELWNRGAGEVYVTTPAVLQGKYLSRRGYGDRDCSIPLYFRTQEHIVALWMDGEMNPSLKLAASSKEVDVEPCLPEGGLLFFDSTS